MKEGFYPIFRFRCLNPTFMRFRGDHTVGMVGPGLLTAQALVFIKELTDWIY